MYCIAYDSKDYFFCELGCVVTKQIVEQHGGTVSVYSKGEGDGTTFTVRLPCIMDSNGRNEELFDIEGESNMKLLSSSDTRALLNTDQSLGAALQHITPDKVGNSRTSVEKKRSRVLVVDDSDLSRKMQCKVLVKTKEFLCEQAVDRWQWCDARCRKAPSM